MLPFPMLAAPEPRRSTIPAAFSFHSFPASQLECARTRTSACRSNLQAVSHLESTLAEECDSRSLKVPCNHIHTKIWGGGGLIVNQKSDEGLLSQCATSSSFACSTSTTSSRLRRWYGQNDFPAIGKPLPHQREN